MRAHTKIRRELDSRSREGSAQNFKVVHFVQSRFIDTIPSGGIREPTRLGSNLTDKRRVTGMF